MTSLEIIDSCDGCCGCCMEQSSPPGYLASLNGMWMDDEDNQRVSRLSEPARVVLADYFAKLKLGLIKGEVPCCWLDQEKKVCMFYDERPNICRDFEVGCDGCRSWRSTYG